MTGRGYSDAVAFPVPDDEPLFTQAEAARLLRVKPSTLRYWLDGMKRKGGYVYPPVIRREPTYGDVNWLEFIEAGWLSEYRQAGVQLADLRDFIGHARERFKIEYPLASERPIRSGRDLLEVQRASSIEPEHELVRERDGQLMLTEVASAWLAKVEFDEDTFSARRYWPSGKAGMVFIDPLINFGAPTVAGIRTDVLAEQLAAGTHWRQVAKDWDLDEQTVMAAASWELMVNFTAGGKAA